MEAPESRWEHDFDYLTPIGAHSDWILTQLVNAPDSRWNMIFLFSSMAPNSNHRSRAPFLYKTAFGVDDMNSRPSMV